MVTDRWELAGKAEVFYEIGTNETQECSFVPMKKETARELLEVARNKKVKNGEDKI